MWHVSRNDNLADIQTDPKETQVKMSIKKELLQAEQTIASQAMRIKSLEDLLLTDPMTGLFNRKGFRAIIERECERARRGQSQGGVFILLDLDNFGSIIDMHGPDCRDACLRLMGLNLNDTIRGTDVASYLGGDAFAVLLPDTARAHIATRAQELVMMLNNLALIWKTHEISLRVSAELKTYTAADNFATIFRNSHV